MDRTSRRSSDRNVSITAEAEPAPLGRIACARRWAAAVWESADGESPAPVHAAPPARRATSRFPGISPA